MKSNAVAYIGWLLLLAALGFYGFGVGKAIYLSGKVITDENFPPILSTTISSIQALLLTNLGVVLGISIANPNSPVAQRVMLNKIPNTRASATPLEVKDRVQLFALIVYVLSLIACLVCWGVNNFSSKANEVASVVSESGKMFVGVALAYLTAVLGK